MKKLPVGIQDFRDIIGEGMVYVDKTRLYHQILQSSNYIFLSRPRRFGKSLLVSTLRELFQGKRELFKGLWIEDKLDWSEFANPVIHIDCSMMVFKDEVEEFRQSISFVLRNSAKRYEMELEDNPPAIQFADLIQELAQKTGKKVVVLVDEYDKPIVDVLHLPKLADRNREIMRSFYSVLKGLGHELRFVLLTGVSKLAKVSIFSGLNNLVDISMHPPYNALVGFTQQELEANFDEHLQDLGAHVGMKREDLLARIRRMYNGYRWNGEETLYNPFSILCLLEKRFFDNYWFSTGTPTFLLNLAKEKQWEISEIENAQITSMETDSYELSNLQFYSLLFQTGYLTAKKVEPLDLGALYTLDYPNEEVKISFLTYMANAFFNDASDQARSSAIHLKNYLVQEDMDAFKDILTSLFARIPSKLHMPAEKYYHSLFYMILSLMGVKVDLEKLTDKGIVDGVLELKDKVYLIEFKYGKQGTLDALTDKALRQIEARKYYESYLADARKVILLGVAFLKKHIALKTKTLEK